MRRAFLLPVLLRMKVPRVRISKVAIRASKGSRTAAVQANLTLTPVAGNRNLARVQMALRAHRRAVNPARHQDRNRAAGRAIRDYPAKAAEWMDLEART